MPNHIEPRLEAFVDTGDFATSAYRVVGAEPVAGVPNDAEGVVTFQPAALTIDSNGDVDVTVNERPEGHEDGVANIYSYDGLAVVIEEAANLCVQNELIVPSKCAGQYAVSGYMERFTAEKPYENLAIGWHSAPVPSELSGPARARTTLVAFVGSEYPG